MNTTDKEFILTQDIQEQSLINFANAIGYDAVFDEDGNILRFKCERMRKKGEEYKSVKTMIRLHNHSAEDLWDHITTINTDFQSFVNLPYGVSVLTTLFAGSCKIVQRVKGQATRKGFKVGDTYGENMVSFMTDLDESRYMGK